MRIAIYSRVSTRHPVEHQTIEQQLDRLTAHVQMHAAERSSASVKPKVMP